MSELVLVATLDNLSDANALQAVLEAQGISCQLDDINVVAVDALWANTVGGIKLRVSREDELRSLQIVAQFESRKREKFKNRGQSEIRFICDECHQEVSIDAIHAEGVETCPKCAKYIDIPAATAENTFPFERAISDYHAFRGTGWLVFEVLLLVCFYWAPNFYNGWQYYIERDYIPPISFMQVTITTSQSLLIWSMLPLLIITLIVALTQINVRELGITRLRWKRDTMLSLLVVAAYFITSLPVTLYPSSDLTDEQVAAYYLNSPDQSYYDYYSENLAAWQEEKSQRFGSVIFYLVAAIIANSLAEEITIRGFLQSRFKRLFGSTWIAILLSSALFASYHIYQGMLPMSCIFLFGFVLAVLLHRYNTIIPLIVGHTAVNLFILIPYAYEA